MKKNTKIWIAALALASAGMALLCKKLNKSDNNDFASENEEKKSKISMEATFYEKYVKRVFDVVVAFAGLVISAPIFAISCILIFIEDPGNPMFSQKRVGLGTSYFYIHKLRSMKRNTGDIPTHLLSKEVQDNMILKTGKIIRKLSIDEIPQFIDILRNKMSLVGPRPALWNQYDLIAERDKYGANDVKPGLTGWAQINGRDELEIPVKAKLDGEYVYALRKSSICGFLMDLRCFFGTVVSVISSKGVVEGGTGSKAKTENRYDYKDRDSVVGFGGKVVKPDDNVLKKVLITGKDSYIGTYFEEYARENYPNNFEIETLDMRDDGWKSSDFSKYDIVYHVAGIAHVDLGKADKKTQDKYYGVNTDLAVETAKKAKAEGVKKFVFMSSMIVYGEASPYGDTKVIDAFTAPKPANVYGDSKWQADMGIRELANEDFKVAVLRCPMIYGNGSKGNFPMLERVAKYAFIFPNALNRRSMLYIENLCEFLCQLMLVPDDSFSRRGNVFCPQNKEYSWTYDIVSKLRKADGKKAPVPAMVFNPFVGFISKAGGAIGGMAVKAFGNFAYDEGLSVYPGLEYVLYDLGESIEKTVKKPDDTLPVKEPLVSLVTVAYNSGEEIRKTIESVLKQSYTNIEYRIVDGGSKDNTVEIAEEYKDDFADLGIKFSITSEPDEGIYDAMNKGIADAKGEIIGLINAGDRYMPVAVKSAVEAYLETDYDYYFADIRLVKPDGRGIIKRSKKDLIATSRHWNHPTSFVAKKTYDELGGFKCKGIHDDFEFYLRCRRNKKKIVIQNKVLAEFATGGISNDKSLDKALRRIRDRYWCYLDNDFSPLYILECIAIEAAKMIMI